MSAEAIGTFFHDSKNRAADETLRLLLELAEGSGLRSRLDAVDRHHDALASLVKVPANFRRDLAIGHLVNALHSDDAVAKVVLLETLCQLALCLSGAEYQNRLGITNGGNYLVVIGVKLARELSLTAVVCHNVLGFVWGRRTHTGEPARLLVDA